MRLLLDTHILLWMAAGSPKVPSALKGAILDQRNEVFVSDGSMLEIAVKARIGKIEVDIAELSALVRRQGFKRLGLEDRHLVAMTKIQPVENHNDPFDILLVAQAVTEGLTLVTVDRKIGAHYRVAIMDGSSG